MLEERLYPPERIRLLADWHALVIHRNARPVEVKVTPVWKRRGYERVQPVPVPALPQRPAIEAPRHADPMRPRRTPPRCHRGAGPGEHRRPPAPPRR